MSQHDESTPVETAAAIWAARVEGGVLKEQDRRELEIWLAESVLHRGAYARAQAGLEFFDAHFLEQVAAHRRALPFITRRRALLVGGSLTALAAAASVAVVVNQDHEPAVTYTAERGQIRLVSLPDGSIVTLDTASTIVVDYRRHSRNIELADGRALFKVAKDKNRPFVVAVSGLNVQAIGTSFAVRKFDAAPIEVLIQEGVVEVGRTFTQKPVRVGANTRVLAPIATGAALDVVSVDPADVSRELSWRQGMLAFEDITLGMAAMEFGRYSDTKIVFSDPQTSQVTISGLFSATNPESFARAAAASLGLELEFKDGEIRLKKS